MKNQSDEFLCLRHLVKLVKEIFLKMFLIAFTKKPFRKMRKRVVILKSDERGLAPNKSV